MAVATITREEVLKAYTQLEQRIERIEQGKWVPEPKLNDMITLSEVLDRIKKLEARVDVIEKIKKLEPIPQGNNPYEWMKHWMLPFGPPPTHIAPPDWSPSYNGYYPHTNSVCTTGTAILAVDYGRSPCTHTVLVNGVPQPSAMDDVVIKAGDRVEIVRHSHSG